MSLLDDTTELHIEKAKEAAFRLLSRREHSRPELVRKLQEKGFMADLCAKLVAQLHEQGYQSDVRYAEMWIRSRVAKCHGENKIRNELQQHQISADDIESAFDALDIDWFELCGQAFVKKFRHQVNGDWQLVQKQRRFLWSRGFTEEQINYALKERV